MAQGRIVTIGSFDGVHRGHKALLDFTVAAAKKRKLRSMALTFRVPPKMILSQEPSKQLLSDIHEKKFLLQKQSLDKIEVLDFNDKLCLLKPFHFFRDVLLRLYKARGIVVGADFRFGAGRSAGAVELVQWGGEFEIPVWVIPPVKWNGKTISSSLIRDNLIKNRLETANNMLGHPYVIWGKVIHGHAQGRKLGFRTANLQTAKGKLLPQGVYAVSGWVGKKTFKGVCNIGVRPTLFRNSPILMEVHLFGMHENLIEKEMIVFLRRRLRDEKKFASKEDLIKAIKTDVKRARVWLEKSA